MRSIPMPDLTDDDRAEEFWESDWIVSSKYTLDIIEGLDRILQEKYNLEIGMYDAGTSEYVLTVLGKY